MLKFFKTFLMICIFAFPLMTGGNPAVQDEDAHPRLSAEDKSQLYELLRLKETAGSQVWPGFDAAGIPLIQYDERYEYLVLYPDPPAPWTAVKNDTFLDRPYFYRPAGETEAFAVPVGDVWAGSLDTLDSMNRSMEKQIRERIPPEKLTPVFIQMMAIRPPHHVVALLHESFHAFQAKTAPGRFAAANGVYAAEEDYPFENKEFPDAWNREGELLAAALRTKDEAERAGLIREFIETRKERRSKAGLAAEFIAFERELEWLEGTAKYVEMKFAEWGASDTDEERAKAYRIVRNRLQMDFYSRLAKLGEQHGDLRFYLSGAAMAMLLDKTSPSWKLGFLDQKTISLEDFFLSK
jgi:hypothetical protein